ncbi:MAG: hypothetical protein E7564_07930 [Ruminococcaceae bacterium]|nr:hypothetical protein [Oscillospiraceae bacterium]
MNSDILNEKNISEILMLPYSHHDYAWTCTRAWHKFRYVKIFCDVLDTMKEDPTYTWHIDNIVHSLTPFEEYCPERMEEFKKYVKEGRICITNGGVSLARPTQVGEETYIRNMIEGKKAFEKEFGIKDIPVFFNADTGCGHSQLPQLYTLAGHKYYRFQRPDGILTKKGVPMQFWWEGLDGSKVLTTRGMYGGFWNSPDWMELDAETKWDEKKEAYFDAELSDRINNNASTDVVLQFVGSDDCRPKMDFKDIPRDLNKFMEEWNEREESKMRYATLNEAYKLLETKDVPKWKGVLDHADLSYNFPSKGSNSMWRRRIDLDHAITEVEKLWVIADKLGFAYPEKEIRDLWFDLFEITGHAIEDVQDRDDKELNTFTGRAMNNAAILARKARENIINAVKKSDKLQAVVINTQTRETEQVVKFQVTSPCGISGFDIIDTDGNKLNYQITEIFPEYRSYKGSEYAGVDVEVKVKVPAMGYTTLILEPNGEKLKDLADKTFIDNLPSGLPENAEGEVIFNNNELEVKFLNGKVISINNLKTGKIIKSEDNTAIINLRYEELKPTISWLPDFHNILNLWEFIPEGGKVLANGPVRFTYKSYGKIRDQKASVTYTLNQSAKALDIKVETDFDDAIEGFLWLSVKADADSDFYSDIPFGVEKREFFDNKIADGGSKEPVAVVPCEWEYPKQMYAKNFTAFNCCGAPLALISKNCACYYDYNDPFGELRITLGRALPMKYRTDRWFGQCSEDFDMTGHHFFDLSLLFTEKLGKFSDIQHYHKELIHPLFADEVFGFLGGGFADKTGSMFDTDKENIINTAVYKENGNIIARFFECQGETTEVTVKMPQNTKSVRATDFIGNTLSDVTLIFDPDKGTAKITFKPFKIITLEIK